MDMVSVAHRIYEIMQAHEQISCSDLPHLESPANVNKREAKPNIWNIIPNVTMAQINMGIVWSDVREGTMLVKRMLIILSPEPKPFRNKIVMPITRTEDIINTMRILR